MFKLLCVLVPVFLLTICLPFSAGAERPLSITLAGATVADAPRSISVARLEEMPRVEKLIFDPYLKKAIHYSGVPLKEFVARFARPETNRVRISAIDEYVVSFTREDLQAGAYLLATRMDGALMTRGMGGPVKIVLQTEDPDNSFVQKWIWMINRIEFLTD